MIQSLHTAHATATGGRDGQVTSSDQELVEKAHQVCPYSNATRGNIGVTLTVTNHDGVPA